MKMTRALITPEVVLSVFLFDETSGHFIRREKINQHASGSAAGAVVPSGARQIKLYGVDCMDYDLAWLLTTGNWPTGHVVHLNGNPGDCRPHNLREFHIGAEVTADIARLLLRYDAEDGSFIWRARIGPRATVGSSAARAGSNGYACISLLGKSYYAHRVAWLMTHDAWPGEQIDHINGKRSDNRIANLRDVTHAENCQNKREALPTNKSSGLLGVSWCKVMKRYVAGIGVDGAHRKIGYFDDPTEAHAAYVAAKRELHSTCTI